VTDDTVAVNPALVAFAATNTDTGTVAALSLLERLTFLPPIGAGLLSVTVHASEPAADIEATLQIMELRVDVAAFNWRLKVLKTEPALAVSVTACDELEDETFAVNPTLVAYGGTFTVAGTVTAPLLLDKLTGSPALGAIPLSVTVHATVPAPEIDPGLQESALRAAMPDPLRLTTEVGLTEELLETVIIPVKELTWSAKKRIFNVTDWPGASVIGVVTPGAVKSEPATDRRYGCRKPDASS
jgi:hypothetical protein